MSEKSPQKENINSDKETNDGTNEKTSTDKTQEVENKSSEKDIENKDASNGSNEENTTDDQNKDIIKDSNKENIVSKKPKSEPASPKSLASNERSHEVSPTSSSDEESKSGSKTGSQSKVQSVAIPSSASIKTHFGPYPVVTHCPHCDVYCLTQLSLKAGTYLWTSSAIFCCVGTLLCFNCCMACIPCLIEDFYDIQHQCRNCGALLGEFSRRC